MLSKDFLRNMLEDGVKTHKITVARHDGLCGDQAMLKSGQELSFPSCYHLLFWSNLRPPY